MVRLVTGPEPLPVVWCDQRRTGEVEPAYDSLGNLVSLHLPDPDGGKDLLVLVGRVGDDPGDPPLAWVCDDDAEQAYLSQFTDRHERLLAAFGLGPHPRPFPQAMPEVIALDGAPCLGYDVTSPRVRGRLIIPAWPFFDRVSCIPGV